MAACLLFFAFSLRSVVMAKVDVLGAGITGLWQAFLLQRSGHDVRLFDPADIPSSRAASRLAGAMLAPFCEGEPGHERARDLGVESIAIWKAWKVPLDQAGTLVVAAPRDYADLKRFASVTTGHKGVGADEIAALVPALAGRFQEGLYYASEAHVEPGAALGFLAQEARAAGATFFRSKAPEDSDADWIVDCRGLGARDALKMLRGVRGERIVLECPEVSLRRPIRLLHPRIPFYIVPWSDGRFMIGATVIESDEEGEVTLRSAAELMAAAYALLPELGEARLVDIAAGVRPSFPDNLPRALVRGRRIFVNGMYRNGFLLAPIFARATLDYIDQGTMREGVLVEDHGEW